MADNHVKIVYVNDGRGGYAISYLMAKRELPDPGV